MRILLIGVGLFTCFGLASALLDASSDGKTAPKPAFANVFNACAAAFLQ